MYPHANFLSKLNHSHHPSSTTSLVPVIAATPVPKPSLQIKSCVGREKPMT
jgi:hypothetical protein